MGGSNTPQHTDRFEFESLGIFSSTTTDISEALHAGVDLADVEMADQTECIDPDAKQMISVSSFQYHRPFITATLKIQQTKIGIIPTWQLDTDKTMTQSTCHVLFTF